MTSITSDNEYDPSRLASKGLEHQNNGQGNNGKPEDDRKLFVGGLTWDTTPEDLREYFSSFGQVLDCSIKQDPSTGRSRGFAFLVFDSKDIVEKILSQSAHFVKGRKVDPKPAHRRAQANNSNSISSLNNNNNNHHHHHHLSSQSSLYGVASSATMPYATMPMGANANPYSNNRKVFIGGLDPSFPDSQLREYFSNFGKIDEIDLPYDKEKNERRPFCFISFQSEQAAQEVLRLQRHTIGDISVDVKRAKPKTVNNQQQQQQQQTHLYDPYGQQAAYANYNPTIPSYGGSAYPAADPYANWNAYNYNTQANSAATAAAATGYPYQSSGSTGVSSPGTSSYPPYAEHQSNSQYSYPPSNSAAMTDYYSHYQYGAPAQPAATSVYPDPNTYAGGYEYGSYYPPMNTGGNVTMMDNGAGQQSSGNPTDHEHDNRHGKTKTSIVADPTYHPYSRN